MCYYDKKKIHGCLYIWNISSLIQLDISPVSAIELNSRREIPYLRAPVDYSLFLLHLILYVITFVTAPPGKRNFSGL